MKLIVCISLFLISAGNCFASQTEHEAIKSVINSFEQSIPGGMGGKEAIAKFTEMDPQVKVIVSSGYSTDPIMANYDDYGFSGRLAKPFKLADMGKEISRVMALRDR